MNEKIDILTKVYGYVNRIKIELSFKNIVGVWKVVNELSDYLVSVDVSPTKDALDEGYAPTKKALPSPKSNTVEVVDTTSTLRK